MEEKHVSVFVKSLKFIGDNEYSKIRLDIEKISNKLNALRKSQLND